MEFLKLFKSYGEMDIGEKEIFLVSASPRRREMMKTLGPAKFGVVAIDEDLLTEIYLEEDGDDLMDLPAYLSMKKALATQAPENTLILTADTVVISDGKILGKPKDKKEEEEMLRSLFGKSHVVATGFTIRDGKAFRTYTSHAHVDFVDYHDWLEPVLSAYLEKHSGKDKAGAYGIQDVHPYFVKAIHGDYNTVIGLPLTAVREKLHENGWINPWNK